MNPNRSFLIIILSYLLTLLVCQAGAAQRTAQSETDSRVPVKVETTRDQPNELSQRTPSNLQPTRKSPPQVNSNGFCCKEGTISSSTETECKKSRGTFFLSESEADRNCQGYCCADFVVSQTSAQTCRSSQGTFFKNPKQAQRFCESQKGYCCIKGETRQLTKRECKVKNGEFYNSKKIASIRCRPAIGFCNHTGKTLRMTQEQCRKKKGNYFESLVLAHNALVKLRQHELTEAKSERKIPSAKEKVPGDVKNKRDLGVASPLALKKIPGVMAPPPGPGPEREPRDSGHPDLVLKLSLELPEPQGYWGTPTVKVNVKNVGDQATSAETTVDLILTDYPPTHYVRTLIPFWSEMIPPLAPNMEHEISYPFNISKNWKQPGMQTIHTILPGTFQLVSRLNTELLAVDEESGNGANEDQIIFDYSGETGFYDLAMLGARLANNNRLRLSIRNDGVEIPAEKYAQMSVAISIDGGAFKRIKLATVDPQGSLTRSALAKPSPPPRLVFDWPLPAEAGSDGLEPFATGARHQVTARVGRPAYNNNVHFAYDSRPGNNEKVHYFGGRPDLVVCFKKMNLSKTARYSYYPPRVKNIGNGPSGPANLRFWIEDKGVKNYSVPSLPAGGEFSIQRKVWWVAKGVRRFSLKVDNNTDVDEGPGELNNIIAGKICVSSPTVNSFNAQGCANSETLCSDAPGMAYE